VIRVHGGALAEEYAVSSTTLAVVGCDDHSYGPNDINKVGCMKSVDDTHGIACSLCDS